MSTYLSQLDVGIVLQHLKLPGTAVLKPWCTTSLRWFFDLRAESYNSLGFAVWVEYPAFL